MFAVIYVVECNLGDEGCRHLAKGQWASLHDLGLGKYLFTLADNKIKCDGYSALYLGNWRKMSTIFVNFR